ncbi:hypothetical protein F5B21DRAFT_522790 [Xylaria acuta]|nr:hypothetical protein F5B21DRAFT_522790 [Xylaria acuta]
MSAVGFGAQTRRPPLETSEALNWKLTGANSQNIGHTRRMRSHNEHLPLNTDPLQTRFLSEPSLECACAPPITPVQKWQSAIDGESAGNERQPKRPRLTRENLARFFYMAGRRARHADNLPNGEIGTTKASAGSSSLKGNDICLARSKCPTNFEHIHAKFLQPSGSVSPTESEFKRYRRRIERAPNEPTILAMTHWMLLKQYEEEEDDDDDDNKPYLSAFSQHFSGFQTDVGLNNWVSAPQPDFVEGLSKEQFDPFPLDAVSGAVLYPDKEFSIVLPHIAGEWKEHGKSMQQAQNRSAYNGAALVYARTQALNYLGEKDSPGDAKVITFTTDGATLNLFANYASRSGNGNLRYRQYLIESHNLVESYDAFKAGRRMLRNAQDFAKEQSEGLRDRLRRHGNNPPNCSIEIGNEEYYQSPDGSRSPQRRKRRAASTAGSPMPRRGQPAKQEISVPNGLRIVLPVRSRGDGAHFGLQARGANCGHLFR